MTAPEKYPVTKQHGRPKKALDLRVPSVKCMAAAELNKVEECDPPCCSTRMQHTSIDEPNVLSTNTQQCDKLLTQQSVAAVEYSAHKNTELPNQQDIPDQLQCCNIPYDNHPVLNEAGHTTGDKPSVLDEADGKTDQSKSNTEPDPLEHPNVIVNTLNDDVADQPQSQKDPDKLEHERVETPGQDNTTTAKCSDQSGVTLTITTGLISVECSDQSGEPGIPTTLKSSVTSRPGEPTEVCLNQTGTNQHIVEENITPVHDSINVTLDLTDIPSTAKIESVPKLRALASKTLQRKFPGMDYLDIAKAIDKFNQNKLFHLTHLSVLCYKNWNPGLTLRPSTRDWL